MSLVQPPAGWHADVAQATQLADKANTVSHYGAEKSLATSEVYLPDVPGVEIEALFLPALTGYEVGGDFYDVFEITEGRWAVVVGDVCGKGVEAAALTGMARHTLRAVSDVAQPSEALEALNRAMLRESLDGRFCTVAMAFVEPDPEHPLDPSKVTLTFDAWGRVAVSHVDRRPGQGVTRAQRSLKEMLS